MDEKALAQKMIEFIRTRVLRDPSLEIAEETPLLSSGLVDSFALVEVLLYLEEITRRKIYQEDVSLDDLDSVREMLLSAERVGRAQ
jgi:acyl carrier protein